MIIFGHTPPGVWEAGWRGPGRHWFQHYANARYDNDDNDDDEDMMTMMTMIMV